MISCIIIDDEPSAINLLAKYASDIPYLEVIATFNESLSAGQFLKENEIDLVFLDIQMPKLTGLQFLDTFATKSKVIFTTAYSQYAITGYEYPQVIDYLMKPIPFERFLKGVEKAFNLLNKEQILATETTPQADFILVKTEYKGKFKKIEVEEIVYVEGMLNYVSIYTRNNEKTITYIGIGEIEQRLDTNVFVRVHRSYIVSIKNIVAIDGNELVMQDAPRIPIGEKYKVLLFEKFSKNLIVSKNQPSTL
jgi:two-component system, LytTR family, response regulator